MGSVRDKFIMVVDQDAASIVEIEPSKIGLEGNRFLGQLDMLNKWSVMFAAYGEKTLDLREKQCLREVANALDEDAERVKMALAQHCMRRGAAKITDAPPSEEQN